MINKLISIKNTGKFYNCRCKCPEWDGTLKTFNIIYAPNGSGKTTLSLIFQSLLDKPDLLKKKLTFAAKWDNSTTEQIVQLKVDGQLIEYKKNVWNKPVDKIEVFNI